MASQMMTTADQAQEMLAVAYAIETRYRMWPRELNEIYPATKKTHRIFERVVRKQTFTAAQVTGEADAPTLTSSRELYQTDYTIRTVQQQYQITRLALDTNLYFEQFEDYNRQLERSFEVAKENQAILPIALATSPTAPQSDGVTLASVNHPIAATGGVQANTFTIPVDLALMPLEFANIKIGQLVDEGGNPMSLMGKKLIVGTLNGYVAQVLCYSPDDPSTANRAINPMYHKVSEHRSLPDGFRINHYVQNRADWFIMTNLETGRQHYELTPFEIQVIPSNTMQAFTGRGYEAYVFGFDDWRAIFFVTGQGQIFPGLS